MTLGKSNWKDNGNEDRYRPYLPHLDFPSFNGNKEEFATYRYTVLNLKAQMRNTRPQIPRTKANLKLQGSTQGRCARNGTGLIRVLSPRRNRQTPDTLKKRLNIGELDLETEAFKQYFNDMMRKEAEC